MAAAGDELDQLGESAFGVPCIVGSSSARPRVSVSRGIVASIGQAKGPDLDGCRCWIGRRSWRSHRRRGVSYVVTTRLIQRLVVLHAFY